MKRNLFICSLLLFLLQGAKGQDINFSQFYELPLLRNPALAGIFNGDIRLTTAARSQWGSVSVPYQTQALSGDFKFALFQNSGDYLALGLQVTNDLAGDSRLGKTQLFPALTYHKSLSAEHDSYISLGFLGGVVAQRFDPSRLHFDDQFVNGAYSPMNPTRQTFENTNYTYWDASAGLVYSTTIGESSRFYIGASYFHFTEPRVAFNSLSDIRLNKKYCLNAGVAATLTETNRLIGYLDYFIQGGNRQGQGGLIFEQDLSEGEENDAVRLSAGSFIRWNDAVIPMLKLEYRKVAIGMTYDVNISKLEVASKMRGGFELTLSYRNFLNMNSSSADKVRCPSF